MKNDENEAVRIELEFSTELSLRWKVEKNEAANIWLKTLLISLASDQLIKNRFAGFRSSNRDELFLQNQLNSCIEIINRESTYRIEQVFKVGSSQELLNSIHHHFSVLIGKEGEESSFWKGCSSQVKSAVCGLNDYVHEIEALRRSLDGSGAYCCVEFFEAAGIEIPARWDHLFTLDQNFGDITLHYDQIGKTWLEVLIDEDESIIDEAIRPLSRITGSFNVNFFAVEESKLREQLVPRASKLGLNFDDRALRLGQLKVASLEESEFDQSDLLARLGDTQEISSIRVLKGSRLIKERKLDGNLERYFDKVQWK